MGIADRKQREKTRRRQDILKAARRLITLHGVEGMSMNQLAEATELNKATLYLYFSNKDDLVDAIVYEGLVQLEKAYDRFDPVDTTGLEFVLTIARATFAFYRQHPLYFHTLNHQERRRVEERQETPFAAKGNEVAARVFERIGAQVRRGCTDGSVRSDVEVDLFLVLFFAQMYGVMHTIHAKEDVYRDVLGAEATQIESAALELLERYLQPAR